MTASDPNWSLRPKIGMGPIRFGQTSAEVAGVAGFIGGSAGLHRLRLSVSTLDETLALAADALSDTEREELRRLVGEQAHADKTTREVRGNSLVHLEYDDDRLTSIMALRDAAALNMDGLLLFKAPRPDVLRMLETRNGRPGVCFAQSIFFEELSIDIYGFTDATDTRDVGLVLPADDTDGPAITIANRTVISDDVRHRFFPFSFLR